MGRTTRGEAMKDFGLGVCSPQPILRSKKSMQEPEPEKGQSRQAKMQKRRRQRKWAEELERRVSEMPKALTDVQPATATAPSAAPGPASAAKPKVLKKLKAKKPA